ncbi:hypothetical protein JDW21_19380 [Bacillus subtilis]|nr:MULTISPECIES: hypothetical protein [Bacillus subtilis group]YP_010681718.1 hypothetical protein PQE76_gp100 [Bacillus phage vB_BsuS_PJN02]MCR4362026.1 hypothetical protein [Bacillus subtilis]UNH58443.1 hypothetical protein [Bacillus phage vB_BsuS_PJN02]UQB84357.1 hypothetical protein KMZ31_19755 [Bacillus amyloliquefaciens]WOF32995.1 hypothetical protein OEJ84_22995 [Bacillus subtilis]
MITLIAITFSIAVIFISEVRIEVMRRKNSIIKKQNEIYAKMIQTVDKVVSKKDIEKVLEEYKRSEKVNANGE